MTQNDHALALLEAGQPLEAVSILRDLAWRAPSYKAYMNLGAALRAAGEFQDAILYLTRAIRMDAATPNAWMTLANISTDVGDWEHAQLYYEGAFYRTQQANDPIAFQRTSLGLAQSYLRSHRFTDQAWQLWEFGRYGYSYSALPGTKRWLGEPCDSLLVVCEGGYGDAMLFGRWLPFTKTRAKHVKLVIWDRMTTFRDWSALGVDEVIPKSAEISPEGIEYTTSWMSLPGIAGMRSLDDIPYDSLNNWRWADGRAKFPDGPVGFCWRAEETSTIRRVRSLPCADAEAIALNLAAYGEVISLCPRGKHLYKPDAEKWPANVTQGEALLDGWDRTASTIRSCKFVVTVDTAVAHLAGLCGVPTLLLLPTASDWKWGTIANQLTDSWYGPHMIYYRNPDPLKWQVEDIALGASMLGKVCVS